MTFDEYMERGRINAQMPNYKRKKAKAIAVCVEMLSAHEKPYVSLSGGKDSVAMAFIVDEAAQLANKNFTLWSHISDASFPGTLETCKKVAEKVGRKLDVYKHGESAFDLINNKKRQAFGKKGVFFDSVIAYSQNKDLAFVGVRAGESKRRMQAAKAHGMCFHSKSMGDIDVCNPLQWFSIYDVASVLYEYNAPIHPIYKKFSVDDKCNANGEPIFIRLGYITSKDLLDKGTAVFTKTNYPEIFNKLREAFPEIGNYT